MEPKLAKGKELDRIALLLGLKRKRYWIFFKEFDKNFRKRIEERVFSVCSRKISVLGCKLCRG